MELGQKVEILEGSKSKPGFPKQPDWFKGHEGSLI